MYSDIVQQQHTGVGIEFTVKMSYWLEKGEEMGNGKAEGLSAKGNGGQAVISHLPDDDGTGSGAIWILVLVSCWILFYLPS